MIKIVEVNKNLITNITRKEIFELLTNGFVDKFENLYFYPYYGVLDEDEFLNEFYDFDKNEDLENNSMKNNSAEIIFHRKKDINWIFENLKEREDAAFLNFLCTIFHPQIRDENKNWQELIEQINNLLNEDGYELYVNSKISGRDIYSWKFYNKQNDFFIPFSQRNKEVINKRIIDIKISRNARYQIYKLFLKFNENFLRESEFGIEYTIKTVDLLFEEISTFYPPQNYEKNKLIESTNIEDFILYTFPQCVLDAVEFYSLNTSNTNFQNAINKIFALNSLDFKIINNEIHFTNNVVSAIEYAEKCTEVGIERLLLIANEHYTKGELSTATEKIWDAFERIKTYYNPALNKKNSSKKIVNDISMGCSEIKEEFNEEFKKLTEIGNKFTIRHYEKDKIDIIDKRHYDYLYKRCLALITTVIDFLDIE